MNGDSYHVPIVFDNNLYTQQYSDLEEMNGEISSIVDYGDHYDYYNQTLAPKRRFNGALQTGPYKRPDYTNQNNNTYKAVIKNGKTDGIDIESTQYNILTTVANEHNAGTTAPVRLRLKGDKGITKPIAINGTKGVFLERGTSRELEVQCKNVGELSWIWLENKGTDPEDGLLLSSIQISQPSTGKVWFFSIGKWLSRHDGERLSIRDFRGKAVQLTHYRVTVVTGNFAGAGTDSRVSLIMYGQVGESPQFLLTSPDRRGLFAPGAVSKFVIPFSNLGDISRVKVSRDGSGSNSGWFLKRIIVEDPTRPRNCYLFNCNDWISLNKPDDVSHSQVIQSEKSVDFNEHEYHVTFYNSAVQGAGTTSDVFLKLYGRDGADRERWFNNQQCQLRVDGATNQIKLRTRERLGDLSKVKVGLEAKGSSPGWLLDKIMVEDVTAKKSFNFPCGQWIIPDRDGATVSRYLPLADSKDPSPVIPEQKFEMTLFTKCDRPIMGRLTDVFFRLFGPKEKNFDEGAFNKSIKMGNFSPPNRRCSPIICIPGEQLKPTGESVFKFTVNGCHRLSPSSKLSLGHDAPQKSSDWFVEKIMLYCLNTGITQIFHCKKWFPFTDKELKRKIGPQYTVTPSNRPPAINNADWQVEVYTSEMRDGGTTAPVYMTLYGDQGKTDEIWLNEAYSADEDAFFDRGSCKIFKLNLPPIGNLSKLRIRHDGTTTSPDWYLEKVIIQHLPTRKSYLFTCNRWFGVGDNTTSNICEIPAFDSNGDQPLSVCHYKVIVHTSQRSSERLSSNVYINIFGTTSDTGNRQLLRSGAFTRGKTDEFMIEAVKLGRLKKIRIGHDGSGPNPKWLLEKIIVEEIEDSDNTIEFEYDDWVDRRQANGLYEIELYPTQKSEVTDLVPRESKPLIPRANYTIHTMTGEMLKADTNANLYISLLGDAGETQFIPLKNSQSPSDPFRLGQEDIFQFEAPFVGMIEKAKILLQRKDSETSWYLKNLSVTVNEFSLRYPFTVEKWLSLSQYEDKKELIIQPESVERLFRAVPYEITFYTGSESGSGTDALVFLQLYGNKGAKKTETLLFKPDAKAFATGGIDTFNVYTSEVGDITKIRVGHNGKEPSANWFLEKIRIRKIRTHFCAHCFLEVCPNMRISQKSAAIKPQKCENNRCDCHLETKKTPEEAPLLTFEDRPLEEYWFFSNGWLPPRDIANGQNFCELLPASADQTPLSDCIETVYEIRVRTSKKSGAGTTSQAYITLIGNNSESGDFVLYNPQGQILAQDREAIFRVEAIDLGKINKIRLRHDNTGTSPDWHIQDVTVIESTGDNEREYLFNCNQWLTASASGSGHLIKEFLVFQTKQLLGSGRSIHINECVNGNSSILQKNRFLSTNSFFNKDRPFKQDMSAASANDVNGQKKNSPTTLPQESRDSPNKVNSPPLIYRVAIVTGAYSGAGTSSNVYLILRGDKGDSGKITLNDALPAYGITGRKKFQSGNTDNFLISVPNIGVLKEIRLGHDNSGLSPPWYVDKVEVESKQTGSIVEFPCNQWIGKPGQHGVAYVDLSPELPSSNRFGPTIFYEFKIYTSDVLNAGTDANIFAILIGAKGRQTSEVHLKGNFERAGREVLYVNLEDVGEPLRTLYIKHDNSGLNPAWHLDCIEVRPMGSKLPEDEVYTFKCNRWLSDISGTEVVLNGTVGKMRSQTPSKGGKKATYEVVVTTGNIKNAGTTSRVYLSLIDADGRKEERQLTSMKSSGALFQTGQTDIFVWKDVPLNEVRKIYLRHDNSGISPAWFVNKVIVSQIKSIGNPEQTQTFNCNHWINGSGEEFISAAQSSPDILSPSSSLEDLSLPRNKLPPTPQVEPTPPLPSGALRNMGMLAPQPPLPQGNLNGFQQYPTSQGFGNGVGPNILSVSAKSLQPEPEYDVEVPYKITLETGRQGDAGTKGPVLMNLVGPNGDSTGWLFFQTLAGNTELPAGSFKTFVFSAPSLSEIKAIEIYDQSEKQSGSGWYLKHLVVEIPSSKLTYDIPCDFWVTNKKDGSRAYHRITISSEYLIKKESAVSKGKPIQTLKLWLGGQIPTNVGSNFVLQIIKDNGVTSDVEMVKQDWILHSRLLMLQFYAKEDVNLASRIKLQFRSDNENENEIDWRILSAILEREDEILTKQYFFTEWQFVNFNQHVLRICELTSTPPAKPSVTAYRIRVKTSNLPEAGTNANVYIRLLGDKAQSADIRLKDSEYSINPFERNQIDQFTIMNLPDLGDLTSCRLWHDNRMEAGAWNCEWVYVTEVLPEGSYLPPQSWYFPCNRWIRGDGRSQVVPIDLFPMDMKAAPAIGFQERNYGLPPITEEDDESISTAKRLPLGVEEIEYTVDVETGAAMDAGTDHLGWIIVKGRHGMSPVLKLKDSYGSSTLQRGSTKNFSMTCESLGLIQQVYVGLYDPNAYLDDSDEEPKYVNLQLNRHNQWNCKRILVTDSKDGETYVFNINQWIIATPEISRHNAIAARPAELRYVRSPATGSKNDLFNPSRAPKVTYKITIETGDMLNAGTTANVYITLYGKQNGATSGSQRLQRITNQTFTRGRVDVFFVSCAKLGEVSRVQIEHDNAGSSPEWFVKSITVKEVNGEDIWNFPCNSWISLTEGGLRKELRAE